MKKNKLALALTATLGLGAFAGSAQAINLAENGVGEFNYIPYFSVTKAQDEYINIVNTSNLTVAAKIVFRRGTDSVEVRDFNIILSPRDVWTGSISAVKDASGAVTNAKIITSDNTCTVPSKDKWNKEANGVYSVPFDSALFGSNVALTSSNVLPGFQSQMIKDIKEGYVTVVVMGVSDIGTDVVNSVPYLAKHVNGVPRDCGAIDASFADAAGFASIKGQFSQAENVLRVSSLLVDAKNSLAIGVPVTSLANAFNSGESAARTKGINNIQLSENDLPKEPNVDPLVANVFESNSATLFTGTIDKAERTISAVLMNNSVYGTYDTTSGTKSSWVMTFPTKRALMTLRPGSVAPFKDSVVPLAKLAWDTEEAAIVSSSNTNFSPFSPATPATLALPYEVNVLGFGKQNPLASTLITDADQKFAAGWMQVGFPDAVAVSGVSGTPTFTGMPVIGFEYFENGGLSAANSLGFAKFIK